MKIYVLILMLMASTVTSASIYYCDSSAGGGGDGSKASPFNTLAACDAAMSSNDTLRINQGSTFRENFDISDLNNVLIEAYGDGSSNMPIIYGDVVVANASFDANATYTNVYQYDVNQTISEAYIQVFEDGDMLAYEPNIVDCNNNAGSYYVDGVAGSSNTTANGALTVYVHATGSSDVTSNGSEYTITDPTRTGSVDLGYGASGQSNRMRYIAMGRASNPNGALLGGQSSYLEGCTFFQCSRHAALCNSGHYVNCIGWQERYDERYNCICIEFYIDNGNNLSVDFRDCAFIGPGTQPTAAVTAFGGHNQSGQPYYSNSSMTKCSAYSASSCGGPPPSQNAMTVTAIKGENCTSGWSLGSQTSITVTDFYWIPNDAVGGGGSRAMSFDAPTVTIDGARGLLDGQTLQEVFWTDTNGVDVTITNCSFYGDSNVSTRFFRSDATAGIGDFTFTKNVLSLALTKSCRIFTASPQDVCDVDLNVYYADGSSSHLYSWEGTNYNTNSAWLTAAQALSPALEDASYTNQDPNFTDPNSGDFSLNNSTLSALGVGIERTGTLYRAIPSTSEIFDWPGKGYGGNLVSHSRQIMNESGSERTGYPHRDLPELH